MAARSAHLPGISFINQAPERPETLPRMDIALFVGFASSGPLHIPVPVEDSASFESIFGADLPLAWDTLRNESEYAYLAPAVRAFFSNGGRRCWVVRVAGDTAKIVYLPVPGLAHVVEGQLVPAFAAARSPGSWASALRAGTALSSQTIDLINADLSQKSFDLTLVKSGQVKVGDLLRLTYDQVGYTLFLPVVRLEGLEKGAGSAPAGSAYRVRVTAGDLYWFRPAERSLPSSSTGWATTYDHNGPAATFQALLPIASESPLTFKWPASVNEMVVVDCPGDPASAPATGSLVRLDFGANPFWMLVNSVEAMQASPGSLPGGNLGGRGVRLTGYGLWSLAQPPDPGSLTVLPDVTEVLTFELWALPNAQSPVRLEDLGFAVGHSRYWAALPNDTELFAPLSDPSSGSQAQAQDSDNLSSVPADLPQADLWQAALAPRFPLAGEDRSAVYLPIAIPAYPEPFSSSDAPAPTNLLEFDGLDHFSAALFVDTDLADLQGDDLLAQADSLRYLSDQPRRLRGLHAALGVEEATLIAAPDAVHPGWTLPDAPVGQPAGVSAPLDRPEWRHYLPCNPPVSLPPASQPDKGHFLTCGLLVIPQPSLTFTPPDATGSFTLAWGCSIPVDRFIVEESAFPNYAGAVVIYSGKEESLELYGYSQGDYYYRVRAEVDTSPPTSSDYSTGVAVHILPGQQWQVISGGPANPGDKDLPDDLRLVQRALLRLCAARGDLFALLSLPHRFYEAQAEAYAQDLRSPLADLLKLDGNASSTASPVYVHALSYSEARTLSFGALYHPWVIESGSQAADLRLNPPDGACCGVLARRAYERGAWIAPANELLKGIVALQPPVVTSSRLDLQEARINLLRQEPRGFMCLDADTLSPDPDWRPLNVRRLISLLRRLALRYGPTYVFEPNDAAFKRLVERTFVDWLDRLFIRGAFAGATPETSYQVNVLVTPQDQDAGRFIVELRVAPSLPMRFLTVRLVQSGELSRVMEGA